MCEYLKEGLVGNGVKGFVEVNVKVIQGFVLMAFSFNMLNVICRTVKILSTVLCCVIKFVRGTKGTKLGGEVRPN